MSDQFYQMPPQDTMHNQSKSSQGISPTYQQKHQYPPPQQQNNPPIGMPPGSDERGRPQIQQINPTHQIDMQQHPPPKNINANTYPGQTSI
ncbi:16249_t:CDS:2 [Entrophospora sp. SA101]|nr:332_t:CDS:2 [Entrophospora sp. SA101]CAJ0641288.1 16249_t:CDS:2 [Entrophospora sp. SA101]CAJ0863191.1 15810_t:CDS:2 [Entrophospora sp. SA101]